MPEFLSRHSVGFPLDRGHLDPARSPYAESFKVYPRKHAALSAVVGTNQFLWAVEAATGFRYYEFCKPVEWVLGIAADRVLGHVDDERWFAFLEGRVANVRDCYASPPPPAARFSVLLPFLLAAIEILGKRVYRIENPHHATLVEDTTRVPEHRPYGLLVAAGHCVSVQSLQSPRLTSSQRSA